MMPRPSNQSGFTIMEMVVVLVIITVIAAILTPILSGLIDEARVTRAQLEVQSISRGILNFNKSTGKWPIFESGANITSSSNIYLVLTTPGDTPEATDSDWLSVDKGDLGDVLDLNGPGYGTSGRFAWRGPYVQELGADPWGNAYFVSANNLRFGVNKAGFVISAGPNGTIETTFDQDIGAGSSDVVISGDDLVARLR